MDTDSLPETPTLELQDESTAPRELEIQRREQGAIGLDFAVAVHGQYLDLHLRLAEHQEAIVVSSLETILRATLQEIRKLLDILDLRSGVRIHIESRSQTFRHMPEEQRPHTATLLYASTKEAGGAAKEPRKPSILGREIHPFVASYDPALIVQGIESSLRNSLQTWAKK